MSAPLIEVRDLYCERDERILFEGLNFSVNAGEVWQVEGPNGSGKTTLLRILSSLSRAFEGEIFWRGESVDHVRDDFMSSLLYFGHLPGIKATLTPQENLRWYSAIHPMTRHEGIDDALHRVGLLGYEDVPCHALSAGQKRRVSLARLYLSDAPLWILDEPFTAIDKGGVAEKEALIAAHAAKGGTVILTTHHELGIRDNLRKVVLGGAKELTGGKFD